MTHGSTPVYSPYGSGEFNQRMHDTMLRITADVQKALDGDLVALILGGGYGHGEGGLVRRDGMELPYNDVDFTLVVRRKRSAPNGVTHAIAQAYERELKIDVDFSRPLTVRDIERWPRWLMWFDLLHGHVVLTGSEDVLTAHAPAALHEPLPVIEATRLLLNRGAGLLWAKSVAQGCTEPPDSDFVRRNYQKCALALGDALMIAYERFATPYAGRDERLRRLAEDELAVAAFGLTSLYEEALRFKFLPDDVPLSEPSQAQLAELARRWGEVFLHVERLRTGRDWPGLGDYAHWHGVREREQNTVAKWPRNLVRNLQMGTCSVKYPREGLYRQLPRLLGQTEPSSPDWSSATEGFLTVWSRFN